VVDEAQEQCDDDNVNRDGDGEVFDALLDVAARPPVLLAGVTSLDPREKWVAQDFLPRQVHHGGHDDGEKGEEQDKSKVRASLHVLKTK